MKTKKHNHTLTNILKVFVFSLMILMPFIIFIPNAFYYGFNETAIAQEKTEQVPVYYETNEVSTIDDLVVGNVYTISVLYNGIQFTSPITLGVDNVWLIQGNMTYQDNNTGNYPVPYLSRALENQSKLYYRNGEFERYLTSDTYVIDFIYRSNNGIGNLISYIFACPRQYFKEYQPLTTSMSITDSMAYAWKSTWQNDLFSWTNNTAIYSGINATTSGIGISENSYLANYLTYIFLLTIIYVIIDIILGVFTMLTHIFNKEPK